VPLPPKQKTRATVSFLPQAHRTRTGEPDCSAQVCRPLVCGVAPCGLVSARPTRRHTPQHDILHSDRCEHPRHYTAFPSVVVLPTSIVVKAVLDGRCCWSSYMLTELSVCCCSTRGDQDISVELYAYRADCLLLLLSRGSGRLGRAICLQS
jgi:hypothetical protein